MAERIAFGRPELDPNRLVCDDGLTVLHGLAAGSIDLAYVDPPFFSGSVRRGRASDGRAYAFADRWPDGLAAYLGWLGERLVELHRVLAETGSLFVHLDWRVSHHARVALDELFGAEQFRNELIWHYGLGGRAPSDRFARKHDTILFYARSPRARFVAERGEVTPAMTAKYAHVADDGRRYMRSYGRRYYLQGGKRHDSVWAIPTLAPGARERVGYPTQKPLALLERIVRCASAPGDVVCDPCVGSGTTAVAALALERRFVVADSSPDAVAISRARLVEAARVRGGDAPDLIVEN